MAFSEKERGIIEFAPIPRLDHKANEGHNGKK